MSNLELLIEPIEYRFSDCFVPLKATRHIPKILSEKDSVIRYYELFLNALITGAQICMYYSFYDMVSK